MISRKKARWCVRKGYISPCPRRPVFSPRTRSPTRPSTRVSAMHTGRGAVRCGWRGRNVGTPTSWRLRCLSQNPKNPHFFSVLGHTTGMGMRIPIRSKKNDALRTCCFRQFNSHIASLLAFASTSPQSTFVFACEASKQASKRKGTKHQPRAFGKSSAISTYLKRYIYTLLGVRASWERKGGILSTDNTASKIVDFKPIAPPRTIGRRQPNDDSPSHATRQAAPERQPLRESLTFLPL